MTIERQVQHRSMFGGMPAVRSPFGLDGKISDISPGCSSRVPSVRAIAGGDLAAVLRRLVVDDSGERGARRV